MRREIVALIEAARALNIQQAPLPDNPHNIKIIGDRADFPERLYHLAVALEAVDRAGSQALEGMKDPATDAARLRQAIDHIFRWMRSVDIDVTEPHEIVANALGVQPKAGKAYKPVPQYAHNAPKKAKAKPMLDLLPEAGDSVSLSSLRQRALQAEQVQTSLGPAAPRIG